MGNTPISFSRSSSGSWGSLHRASAPLSGTACCLSCSEDLPLHQRSLVTTAHLLNSTTETLLLVVLTERLELYSCSVADLPADGLRFATLGKFELTGATLHKRITTSVLYPRGSGAALRSCSQCFIFAEDTHSVTEVLCVDWTSMSEIPKAAAPVNADLQSRVGSHCVTRALSLVCGSEQDPAIAMGFRDGEVDVVSLAEEKGLLHRIRPCLGSETCLRPLPVSSLSRVSWAGSGVLQALIVGYEGCKRLATAQRHQTVLLNDTPPMALFILLDQAATFSHLLLGPPEFSVISAYPVCENTLLGCVTVQHLQIWDLPIVTGTSPLQPSHPPPLLPPRTTLRFEEIVGGSEADHWGKCVAGASDHHSVLFLLFEVGVLAYLAIDDSERGLAVEFYRVLQLKAPYDAALRESTSLNSFAYTFIGHHEQTQSVIVGAALGKLFIAFDVFGRKHATRESRIAEAKRAVSELQDRTASTFVPVIYLGGQNGTHQ